MPRLDLSNQSCSAVIQFDQSSRFRIFRDDLILFPSAAVCNLHCLERPSEFDSPTVYYMNCLSSTHRSCGFESRFLHAGFDADRCHQPVHHHFDPTVPSEQSAQLLLLLLMWTLVWLCPQSVLMDPMAQIPSHPPDRSEPWWCWFLPPADCLLQLWSSNVPHCLWVLFPEDPVLCSVQSLLQQRRFHSALVCWCSWHHRPAIDHCLNQPARLVQKAWWHHRFRLSLLFRWYRFRLSLWCFHHRSFYRRYLLLSCRLESLLVVPLHYFEDCLQVFQIPLAHLCCCHYRVLAMVWSPRWSLRHLQRFPGCCFLPLFPLILLCLMHWLSPHRLLHLFSVHCPLFFPVD